MAVLNRVEDAPVISFWKAASMPAQAAVTTWSSGSRMKVWMDPSLFPWLSTVSV
jgi:hypothetical protein